MDPDGAVTRPILHLMCGKIGAGKSTLAARLAEAPGTVLVSEDDWLGALFADRMETPADYLHFAAKLREAMGPHVRALLTAGVSVVLDYPANTREQRAWLHGLIGEAEHRLHWLDLPDEACLARLHRRNAAGTHPFEVADEHFRRVTRHFEPPRPEEGFAIQRHGPSP